MSTMPVVVGVDGSEESLRAVAWAAGAARRHGAPLRIVSVPAMPPRMRGLPGAPQTVAGILRGASERALSKALTRAGEVAPEVLSETELLSGAPAVAVTESGAGALMLVVGASGVGGFAGMLLGSVSRYAAKYATCPVVVAREEMSAGPREVAVGVHDNRDSGAALGFAFDEAARRGATLVAVRSWAWMSAALNGPGGLEDMLGHVGDAERIQAGIAEYLAVSLVSWQEKYPGVPVRLDVVRGHPARVLASYSARADLVVIGKRSGGHAVDSAGEIQQALLTHAHGPVAVIPDEG